MTGSAVPGEDTGIMSINQSDHSSQGSYRYEVAQSTTSPFGCNIAPIPTSFIALAWLLVVVSALSARAAEVRPVGRPSTTSLHDPLRQEVRANEVAAASAQDAASWYVYGDAESSQNHGFWSNVVPPDGHKMLRIELADRTWRTAGTTAIRLDIAFNGGRWCAIAVASAPGYWGERPGEGFDLRNARALSFRARGASGGERIRIKAAVAGDQPFGDAAPLPIDSGWLQLSADWREYHIDTDGRDLSRVITPFALIANDKHNPGGRLTVFLDDIRYEMTP